MDVFAEKDREKTLEIISNYLLDKNDELNTNRRALLFSLDNEIKKALELVYTNGNESLKQKTIKLINTLIERGGSMFWGLKDVIK